MRSVWRLCCGHLYYREAKCKRTVHNFTVDLSDCEAYVYLMQTVAPIIVTSGTLLSMYVCDVSHSTSLPVLSPLQRRLKKL